jgi:DNA-binding transcriptional ArsR family regulator
MSLLPSRPDASPSEDAGPRVIGVDSDDADEVLSALSSGTARQLLSELHDDPAPPSEVAERVDTSLQNAQYHLEKLEAAGAVEVVETAYSEKGREMDVYAPADQPLVIFAGDQDDGSMLRSALSRLLGAVGVLGAASLAVQELFGQGSLLGGEQVATPDGGDGGGAFGGAPDGGDGGDASVATETTGGDGASVQDVGGADGGTATRQATETGGSIQAVEETETPVAAATETPARTPVETVRETAAPGPEGTEVVGEATRTTVETAASGGGLPPGLLFFAGGLLAIAVVAVALALRG